MKRCNRCGQEKPPEMFVSAGNKLAGHCKACAAAKVQARRSADRDKANEVARAWYASNRESALASAAKWKAKYPERYAAAQHQWREAHKDELREQRQRKLAEMTPEQRAAANVKRMAAYHAKRAPIVEEQRRIAAEHPEIAEQKREAYLERRRDGYREWRARKGGAPVVERVVRADIIKRDNSTCYLCGAILDAKDITLDHVAPFSRGGPHTADNVRVACRPCNGWKQDRLIDEL